MVNARHLLACIGATTLVFAMPAGAAFAQVLDYGQVLERDGRVTLSGEYQQQPTASASSSAPPAQPTAMRAIPSRRNPAATWRIEAAEELLYYLERVDGEGLNPDDYHPDDLRTAIEGGEGERLDAVAGTLFTWIAEDLRDGITPVASRRGYLMEDPDAGVMPTATLTIRALATGDPRAVLAGLLPTHPFYAALRDELAATPVSDTRRRNLIRANMDRWRWLPRDLGDTNLLVNVPEFMLRLTVDGQEERASRVIVGRPGRSATPQLSEIVEGVIFNPTWTVPQSIVVGEGLGSRVLNNPSWARTMGYVATRSGGSISVVQQPGPRNALGLMKLDMPNQYAIFLHDTPARSLFQQSARALSHGCVRVENALDLAMAINRIGQGVSVAEAQRVSASGTYTRVPLAHQIPVYIAYFTAGVGTDGLVTTWADIYDRDAPVLASLAQPSSRQL